ncbi:hypothetical protein DNTS_032587 [Danionella cerebrum]|uniref:RRM domain-containing protein n=1 Tax=Danionella cerebrum TaxID=2873325 RepID=A0A553PY99_9TELE|nr:hypothetical protein DNTS_032587 [Danionella translucida]
MYRVEYDKHDVFDLDGDKISNGFGGGLDPSILSMFQEKSQMECVETEASLLSALTEILDCVDVETLSPFDTLPDAEIFSIHKADIGVVQESPPFAGQGKSTSPIACCEARKSMSCLIPTSEVIASDRQLRPRCQFGYKSETQQRNKHEKIPKESKCRFRRIFRIESDPTFTEDTLELLADLVRHMHPYCISGKDHSTEEEDEDNEFIDVEGYEEQEDFRKELIRSTSLILYEEKKDERNSHTESQEEKSLEEGATSLRNAPVPINGKRMKKSVKFAEALTTVYEIPLDNDEEVASDHPESLDSSSKNMTLPPKPKLLSLDQYRLLRQKNRPSDWKRMDYRAKWPSIAIVPRELPPFLPDMFNQKLIDECQPRDEIKAVESIALQAPTEVQSSGTESCVPYQGNSRSEPGSTAQKTCQNTTVERRLEATCGEIGIEATDVTSLLEQFETRAGKEHLAPEPSQDEIPIRLIDLSSTAELTPPATPPHQSWRPLVPAKGTKQSCKKASNSKTIQIIDPRPLPPSKMHPKTQLTSCGPTLEINVVVLDHDYCSTECSPSDQRTISDCLSGSVLLSPDSSPCTSEAFQEESDVSERRQGLVDRGRRRRRNYERRYRHASSESACSSCSSSRSRSPPTKRLRHSGSSSSSRSSSRSTSRSPPRKHNHRRSRSRSESRSRYLRCCRSGSRSPELSLGKSHGRWKSCRQELKRQREEARKLCQQKAIEERRVVFVGGIRGSMSASDLKDRFSLFGRVEDCTVHLRSHGDNYGFVTYFNTNDAYAAIENGWKLRRPDERAFDICFGGRRQFCKSHYADLDSNREVEPLSRSSLESFDFDALLREAQKGQKR